MNELIASIQERLGTVPEFKYICEDYGQIGYYSPNFPVQWPVSLISLRNMNFSDIGMDRSATPQNRQMGDVLVGITIADMKLTNSSLKAPATQKNQARSIWLLIEKAHNVLHGFIPLENCSKMTRKNCVLVEREDGVQEYLVTYAVTMNNV